MPSYIQIYEGDTNDEGLFAYSGEIGRLFGLKTAGCSGKSATLLVAPD